MARCTTPNSPSPSFSMISREPGSISLHASRWVAGWAAGWVIDKLAGQGRGVPLHPETGGRKRPPAAAITPQRSSYTAQRVLHVLRCHTSTAQCSTAQHSGLTTPGQSQTSAAARSQTRPPACCPAAPPATRRNHSRATAAIGAPPRATATQQQCAGEQAAAAGWHRWPHAGIPPSFVTQVCVHTMPAMHPMQGMHPPHQRSVLPDAAAIV